GPAAAPVPPGYPAPPTGYQAPVPQPGYGTAPTPDPYAAAYGYQAYPVAAASTSGLAIAALVTGLAGLVLCGFTGPIALILGIVALKQANDAVAPNSSDKPMAITGIVLGGLMTLGWVLWLLIVIIGAASGA
ncbi:DUF4190 domain-containing protein, partial [Gordonia sp. (in: high G+C Gram-positive bacteria)]|uniref:DUF4190 domain-containing protein n=1 Tax=Gordonia sp. (in: high G+C Gram-positive bacteria) TaxID=84139 RepID=UPI0039E2890E